MFGLPFLSLEHPKQAQKSVVEAKFGAVDRMCWNKNDPQRTGIYGFQEFTKTSRNNRYLL